MWHSGRPLDRSSKQKKKKEKITGKKSIVVVSSSTACDASHDTTKLLSLLTN